MKTVNSVKSNLAARVPHFNRHVENRMRQKINRSIGDVIDKIEISDEAKAAMTDASINRVNAKPASADAGKSSLDEATSEEDKEKRRDMVAFRIAMRIARGDNVPDADHRFLAEHDSKLYLAAIRARITAENRDPKDYDSLAEELFAIEEAEALAETSAEILETTEEPAI